MLEEFLIWYIAVIVSALGAVIGSFLNVVIYRFHTGKSLSGSSHCMSCLRPLRWFELLPLFSYLALKGKCRTCRSYIPPRYFVVEFLTAIAFLVIYWRGGSVEEMFLMGILFALLIVIAVYDIYHFIIPNELVVLVGLVALTFFSLEFYQGASISSMLPAVYSALGAFLFYGGLWKVSRGQWIGFGDAKLAIPLAFIAGFPTVFSMVVLSFWVGAVVALLMLGTQNLMNRGQIRLRFFGAPLKMKSEVPFAPFLILGFALSHFYGVDVLSLVAYVL